MAVFNLFERESDTEDQFFLSEKEIIFCELTGSDLTVRNGLFIATWQSHCLKSCKLIYQVRLIDYQHIENQELFHFESAMNPGLYLYKTKFASDLDLSITVLLIPDHLVSLQKEITTPEEFRTYLQQVCRNSSPHPLLSTESWILLSVQQEQPGGVMGFRTLWDYLNWEQIAQVEDPEDLEEDLMQAVVHYLQDTAASQLGIDPEDEVGQQVVTATTDLIDRLLVQLPAQEQSPEAASQQVIDVMTQFLRAVLPGAPSPVPSPSGAAEVSSHWCDRLQQFFDQEHWTFERHADQPVLHLLFKGENGQWNCYAQVRDNPYPLLLFYSVLPLKVPKKKRRSLAEFLSRANYGLLLGNFELDFAEGEIRYKTSLTPSGTDPDSSCLQQWVYSNVLTADRYLPGILHVMEGSSPEIAIAQIESYAS